MEKTNKELTEIQVALSRLGEIRLPVKTSFAVSKQMDKVNKSLVPFTKEKEKLFKTYKVKTEQVGNKNMLVPAPLYPEAKTKADKEANEENYQKFLDEWNELLEVVEEINFDKVKLPEKITGKCDKCSHNMDVEFLVESDILTPLIDFIEV